MEERARRWHAPVGETYAGHDDGAVFTLQNGSWLDSGTITYTQAP
jgi:hypothetical protein